jgi:GTP cyclohydrolase I
MTYEEDDDDIVLSATTVGKSSFDLPAITNSVSQILQAIGEDPAREGLVRTPERVARAYQEILAGYQTDPVQLVNGALFNVDYDEMVIVKDIEYYSLCEHHMLPFFGKAHVAYVPKGRVIGLSKIPRIVDMFAHRLQVQERMTQQIAEFIQEVINPWGVGVVIEGQHLCMMMRGIKKEQAKMTTSAMLGGFRKRLETRMEFLNRISN